MDRNKNEISLFEILLNLSVLVFACIVFIFFIAAFSIYGPAGYKVKHPWEVVIKEAPATDFPADAKKR